MKELPILLAHVWTDDHDPTGWWMSEKLDGVRAYWDGKQFLSRKNNIFYAPEWFSARDCRSTRSTANCGSAARSSIAPAKSFGARARRTVGRI